MTPPTRRRRPRPRRSKSKKLSVDDVRHHAEEVRDLTKLEVRRLVDTQATKAAVVGVIAVAAAVDLAFYIGYRAATSAAEIVVIETEPVLRVDRVVDRGDRLEAIVRVASPDVMRTSAFPDLARNVVAAFPGVIRHRCESDSAHGIAHELQDTEIPHLLEHVTLELMVQNGAPRTLRGHTEWDFARDGAGVFRVTIAYGDDEAEWSDARLARSGASGRPPPT